MVTAWQQDRKRKQAAQLKSESVAGLEALLAGVGGIADEQQRQTKEAQTAEERKRKATLDEAESARRTAQDAATAEERKAAGEERAAREADRVLRQKGEADKQSQVLRQKAKADAIAGLKQRAAGGLDEEGLRRVAMNDEALGELDDDAVRAVMLEAQGEEKMRQAKEGKVGAETEAAQALARQRNAPKPVRGPAPAKPPSESQQLEVEKKRLEIAKLKREAAGDGPKEKVEAGTIKEVGDLDATMRGIQDLQRRNPSVGTGFFRAMQNSVAQTLGIDDPKATKYRADIANLSNEIISRLSGANVPPAEMERIAQGLPDFGDDDAAYSEKLAATMERVDRARKGLVSAAKAANRDVAGLEAVDPVQPAPRKKPSEMTVEELEARAAQLRGRK